MESKIAMDKLQYPLRYYYVIDIKPLTFLLALAFLFLFSGSVYGQEEVKKEYYDSGKLKSESHYKDGNLDGRKTEWYENGEVKSVNYYYNSKLLEIKKRDHLDNDELVEFVDYRSWLGQPSYDGAKGTKEIEKLIL